MNYTQVYRRYELKPVNPQLNFSPGQVRSGRKAFAVQKNMQSSGLGPGGDYYLQRYQHMLTDGEQKGTLGTYSSPQFRKKTEEAEKPQNLDSYSGDFTYPHRGSEPVSMAQSPPPVYEPYEPRKPDPPQSYEPQRSDPGYDQRHQEPQNFEFRKPEAQFEQRRPEPTSYDAARLPGYEGSYQPQSHQPAMQADPTYQRPRYDAPVDPSQPADAQASELERLQDQLRQREEELMKYRKPQQVRQAVSQSPTRVRPPPAEPAESFDRISKSLWDKQVFNENRKMTQQALDYQLSEKEMKVQLETLQREKEMMQRLEHLQRLREVETQERLNALTRAQKYREHLDMQRQLKQELTVQERMRNSAPLPQETAPPQRQPPVRSSYEPQTEFEKEAMEFYNPGNDMPTATSLTPFRLTKKSPKTISYNPITGIVRDTSIYLQSNIARPVLKSYLPEPRNQDKVVPEYSRLPAFQQPSYTAKNPKVIVTDPITMKLPKKDYRTQEFFDDAAKFFGVDPEESTDSKHQTSHMADYGAMVLSPQPGYSRDPVISKASGYNYKDTRYLFQ